MLPNGSETDRVSSTDIAAITLLVITRRAPKISNHKWTRVTMELTKESLISLKEQGLTFKSIGDIYGLTEHQVHYRSKDLWGLDFSKAKYLNHKFFSGSGSDVYYWAGILAADGWVEESRNRIGLALQKSDLSHLEKFKKAVSSTHDICPFMSSSAYRIRFNSSDMVLDLRNRFNITGSKTHTYTLPEFESIDGFIHFLRGYIDGDGCLFTTSSQKISLSISSAIKDNLVEIRNLVSIILNTSINTNIMLNINKKGSCYSLVFPISISHRLLEILYSNSTELIRLDRKYNKYIKLLG